MTAGQLPGELTYDDVRSRLDRVLGHIVAAETGHEATAAAVAEAKVPPPTPESRTPEDG